MIFQSDGGEFTGVGLFAAVSYDEGKTWPHRRLVTAGRSSAKADTNGYLAITQTRDGRIQLITSSRHYIFNLAWLIQLPKMPKNETTLTTQDRIMNTELSSHSQRSTFTRARESRGRRRNGRAHDPVSPHAARATRRAARR